MSADDEMRLLIEQHMKQMANYARSELERSSELIARFTQMAALIGIALDLDSCSYVQTIGIVASAVRAAGSVLTFQQFDCCLSGIPLSLLTSS